MAAVDNSALTAQLEALTINVGKLASAIGAPAEAEQRIAELEAELATAQAGAAPCRLILTPRRPPKPTSRASLPSRMQQSLRCCRRPLE
jgi:hypothetical protein